MSWSERTRNCKNGRIAWGHVPRMVDEGTKWFPAERTIDIQVGNRVDYVVDVDYRIVPFAQENDPNRYRCARRIDPRFVDMKLVKRWVDTCDIRHAGFCTSARDESYTPSAALRFIDVEDYCITPAPPNSMYLALSYVWGQVNQPVLLKGNVTAWSKIRALADLSLPDTISDAIILTRSLGQRYLWVDALCIIQNDDNDKTAQISQMDRVYFMAWLTIVAAAGDDSCAGLPGLSVRPRYAHQDTVEVLGIHLASIQSDPFEAVRHSVWNERAWTFQEKLCGRRALVFTPKMVLFWCGKAGWREDVHLETEDMRLKGPNESLNPLTDFYLPLSDNSSAQVEGVFDEQLRFILIAYIQRRLTYSGDILVAFQGIANRMSGLFGDHIWGLPRNWFSHALCWAHRHSLKRREGDFPSWSWSGWYHGTRYNGDMYFLSSGVKPVLVIYQIRNTPSQPLELLPITSKFEQTKNDQIKDSVRRAHYHPHFQSDEHQTMANIKAIGMVGTSAGEGTVKTGQANTLPTSTLLCFYTSFVRLSIGDLESASHGFSGDYSILARLPLLNPRNGNKIGSIVLDKEWYRHNKRNTYDFIVVARHANIDQSWEDPEAQTNFLLMLLDTDDTRGLTTRVQLSSPVPEREWWNCTPERKFIVLS